MATAPAFERPARPAVLQAYADSTRTWETMISLAGGFKHAGDAANPRPMENESLDDLRDKSEVSAEGVRAHVPDALWLVFWNARFRVPFDKGMALPAEQLWLVLEEGDTVLLSDGVTHHYSGVGRLDRDAGTIAFSDGWPEEFFLQAGRNVLGIAARNCTVTRQDFEKVIVGFLTWHTNALLTSCLKAFGAGNAEAYLRAGHAVMAAGPEYLCLQAAPHFLAAMETAGTAGNLELARNAAARAWLAVQCAAVALKGRTDDVAKAALQAMAQGAIAYGSVEELWAELSPRELCRCAHNIGQAGALEAAARAAELAMSKDPQWEDAYRLRAAALVFHNPGSAMQSAQRGLELNAREIARLQGEAVRLGTPPPGVASTNTIRLRRAEHRRVQGLETLFAAAFNAGAFPVARAAVAELGALRPDDLLTMHKRLIIERLTGSSDGIREAAAALLAKNPPPDLKAEADAALTSLPPRE